MTADELKEEINKRVSCLDFLTKSKKGEYCCPYNNCRSGTGEHQTGAVKYYKDTNTWFCFSCNRGGDVIKLYREQTGDDYFTALKVLGKRINETLDPYSPQDTQRAARRDFSNERDKKNNDPRKAPQSAAERPTADYTAYYEKCLHRLEDPAALAYLKARGINPTTAAKMGTGFDPAADPSNAPGAMGDKGKPHPTPRLIFPCGRDTYIARSIDPNTPRDYKAPNPKGSRTRLYNADALYSGTDVVYVTEGVFDCLSFIETGAAAVSTNGKGNGRLLLQQLEQRPTQAALVIVHDNEKKGDGTPDMEKQAATMRQANELNSKLQAMGVKSIVYNVAGEYHDANDAFIADQAAFKANMAAAAQALKRDCLTEFLEKAEGETYKPYTTGLKFFDDLLDGGVIRQSLLLLLAAPATGKTTLCAQIAERMAAHKKPVVYINLEMSREQMIAKDLSRRLSRNRQGFSALKVMQGYKWSDDEKAAVHEAAEEYRREILPYLTYNPDGVGSDIDAIRDYLTRTGEAAKSANKEAPVVVLDYLHLISSRNGLDVQELIKQAVTMLKQYAIAYNTFVIGVTAVNRNSYTNGRITLGSGRDSSNLEYTADYQLSLDYLAIDSGEIKATEPDKIADLQQQNPRKMVIRVLKGRICTPGKTAIVNFNAANNFFYGNDYFAPAGDEPTPFETTLKESARKIIPTF